MSTKPSDQSVDSGPRTLNTRCSVRLLGPFMMTTADGARIEFEAEKEAAIIATLLVSKDSERSRSWLMSHLWSDRGQAQASGSLRTALSRIRRKLIEYDLEDVLKVERKTVQIDKRLVEVDLLDHPDGVRQKLSTGTEFLEGMDVRDDAFDEWLLQFRLGLDSDDVVVGDDSQTITDSSLPSSEPKSAKPSLHGRFGEIAAAMEAIFAQRQLIERLVQENAQILEELRAVRRKFAEHEAKIEFLEQQVRHGETGKIDGT